MHHEQAMHLPCHVMARLLQNRQLDAETGARTLVCLEAVGLVLSNQSLRMSRIAKTKPPKPSGISPVIRPEQKAG